MLRGKSLLIYFIMIFSFSFLFIKVQFAEASYTFTVKVTYQGDIYDGDPVPNGKVTAMALYFDNQLESVTGRTDNYGKVELTLSRDKSDIKQLTLIAESVDKEFEGSKNFTPPLPFYYLVRICFPSLKIKNYYIGKGNSEAFSFAIITDSHIGRQIDDYGTTGWNDSPPDFDYGSTAKCLRREVNWINAHKEQYNIHFVTHTGDITDSGEKSEFLKAKEILDALEIPYVPIMGNHDVWPYTSWSEAPESWKVVLFQNTFDEQFTHLGNILANWKKQEWPGEHKNENYYFDYMHFHFICQDYNSRAHAWLGYGVKPVASLHGTGDWMLGHLNNCWNLGDDNILLFAHHPLKVNTSNLFSFREFDKIRCGLDPKRDNVYRWFGGHLHENNSWPVRDLWHTHEILEVIVTTMGFYRKVGNPAGSQGNTIRIVHVKDNLLVAFDYSPLEPTTADVITFTNQSTYPNWFDWLKWDMGDGNTYYGVEVQHQYPIPGEYKVTLTAKGYDPGASYPVEGAISKLIRVYEAPPQIAVNSPTLNDEWEVESLHNITWEATDDVTPQSEIVIAKIDYSTNGGVSWITPPIAENEQNDGIYTDWQIPTTVSNKCKVRISAKDNSNLEGEGVSEEFRIVWCLIPTDIGVTADNYDQVTLNWVDNSQTNTGYNIAIKKEGENWQEYAHITNPNLQSYPVTGIENDTNYYFRVIAFDNQGHLSDWSDVAEVYLEGIQDFVATPLDGAVFLSWEEPDVPFVTNYLIVRKKGDGEIQWKPTDGTSYTVGQEIVYNDEIDTVIYNSNGTYFQDEDRENGTTYNYAAFAFDNGLHYTKKPQKEDARPTEFISGWEKKFDIIGNNSRKLIETSLDSICVVYLEDYFGDGRAQLSRLRYRSRRDNGTWNDAHLLFDKNAEWNGYTIASSKEGNALITYKGVYDMLYPHHDKDFLRFLTNYPEPWYGEIVAWDTMPKIYETHPAMVVSGDSAFISYIIVDEKSNLYDVDSLRFVAFDVPEAPDPGEINIQKLDPLGEVFDYSSIAVCEESGKKYVHIVWRWGSAAESREDYTPGKIMHIQGWLDGSDWHWENAIPVSESGCHPSIVAGDGNTIYSVWNEKVGTELRDKIYFSYFDGVAWSASEEVCDLPSLGPEYRQRYYPTIVQNNGNVIVAWEMATPSAHYDIFYSERNVTGDWIEPINVFSSVGHYLVNPHITISNDKSQLFLICSEDYNNMVFTTIDLLPTVSVSSPIGGSDWHCGETNEITWDATDNTEGLVVQAIEYSTTGSEPWITIASEEENDGDYSWTVPDTPSENCKIRITVRDHANNIESEESGIWTISDNTAPEVILISPNGGEYLNIGDTEMIRWTATDNMGIGNQQLFYSTNGGTDWIEIEGVVPQTNGEYVYPWTIPVAFSDECRIKVVSYDYAENAGEDISENNFTIWDYEAPEVTVIAPNGGEEWEIGDIVILEWQASDNVGVTGQNLYYSTDMGINWEDLTPASPISQTPGGYYSCEWLIPEVYSTDCLVKVESKDGAGNRGDDISNNLFTIGDFTSPVVTVKRPNGGENLEISSIYSIGWTAIDNVGIAHQNLYYSTDNGLTWASILMEHPVQESSYIYPWDVPETPSSECLIKVESYDKAENKGEDDSNAWFRISWLVSDNEDATGYSPKVVKNNGDLHLVYSSNDSIYYSKSADNGQTFTKKSFIGEGHYPTIVSDGAENIYVLWTDGNKVYYKRSDGTFWFPTELLASISDVTQLRQVVGVIDGEGNLQMVFEGKFTFTRAIPRNIVYYGKMKKDSPNTFTYEEVTENSTLDESANISFGIDASSVAYLAFSHNGEVYSYSNERGYWSGEYKVGNGEEANLDAYDGYVHIVWEQDGAIKHRQRLIGGDWLSEETAAEESGKRFSHPVMSKGCVVVYTESPSPQPDHFSDVVYKIKNRGFWQEKQHITEIMSAGYPQIYVEEYRGGRTQEHKGTRHKTISSETKGEDEIASKVNRQGGLAMTDKVSRRASSATPVFQEYTPESPLDRGDFTEKEDGQRDENATLYTIYTEGSFTPNSVEIDTRDITIPYQTSDILQATAYNFQDKVIKDNDGVIHIVYQDRDTVLYAYSVDEGRTFSEDITLGQGRAPVICLLPDNTVGVLFSANSGDHRLLYKKGHKEQWDEAVPLYRTEQSDIFIQPPNFTVDENGIAYVTLEREQYLIGNYYNWWLSCGSFDAMNPAPVENWSGIDSLLNIPEPVPPPPVPGTVASSDILYDNGTIHLLWSRPTGGIYYSRSSGIPDWRTAFRISLQIGRSFHPSISIYEGRLGCVWQAGDVPEVYYAYTEDYENWTIPENISNTELGSYSPVIAADALILWSEENDAGKTDIVLSSFDRADWTKQNITETDKYTSYPHPVISGYPEAKLGVLYTEGDTEPFNVRYITEDVIIPYHTSNTENATGLNSQQKMVIARNNSIHLVFESNGYIFYTTSIDGEKWALEEYIEDGASPAIALGSGDEPVCVWVKKPYSPSEPYLLMFSRKGAEGWTNPEPLYTSNYYIETPAFVIKRDYGVGGMNADTGYVTFEQGFAFEPDEHSQLIFGEFGLSGFGNIPGEIQTEVIDDATGDRGVKTPSLAVSNSTIHLAYERNWDIIYTGRENGNWGSKKTLSGNGDASQPELNAYGTGVDLVWSENGSIHHRRGNNSGTGWSRIHLVGGEDASSPVICAGSQIIWCEKTEQVEPLYSLYFSRFTGQVWSIPEKLTQGPKSERNPQIVIKENDVTEINYAYTQGDKGPYIVSIRHFPAKIPNLFNGHITENTIWYKDIYVMGDVTVDAGITLTIEPGITVYFALDDCESPEFLIDWCELIIEGQLTAQGTESDSIYFTSAGTEPHRNDWYGVRFASSDTSSMSYVNLEYAKTGISYKQNSAAMLRNSSISNNYTGISATQSSPTIKKCKITDNSSGIYCSNCTNVTIDSCSITNDRSIGLDLQSIQPTPLGGPDSIPVSGTGITFSNCDGVTVTNNTLINDYIGIYASGYLNGVFQNNYVEDNEWHGFDIAITKGSNMQFINNTFINNAKYPVNHNMAKRYYREFAGLSLAFPGIHTGETDVLVKGNTFEGNTCGTRFSKYYTNPSTGTYRVRYEGNQSRNNFYGFALSAPSGASGYKGTFVSNTAELNDSAGVFVWFGIDSGAVNLGDLTNAETTDDGGNHILNNGVWEVMNICLYKTYAQGNFWGTTDALQIDSKIYDDEEEPVNGEVDFSGYYIAGRIQDGETWEGVVSVCGDILVPENATLNIVEGTNVRFAAGYDINNIGVDSTLSELIVDGNLQIKPRSISSIGLISSKSSEDIELRSFGVKEFESSKGRKDAPSMYIPIIFTSDAGEPSPSDWYGIEMGGLDTEDKPETKDIRPKTKNEKKIWSSKTPTIFSPLKGENKREGDRGDAPQREVNYFKIEYAKRGMALCEGENLSMKECAFTNNETGLKLRGYSDVTVKDCIFNDNTNSGILIGEGISGTIKDDSLCDNGVGINIQAFHTPKSPLNRGDFVESENNQRCGNILCPEMVLKDLYVSGNNTGILCGGESSPQIKESKIIINIDYGIYITDDAEPNLGGSGHNCIYGSGTYDLYNNTPNSIMAKKNCWGTMDIDSVESHIYDYYDDSSLGVVEIEPLWNGNKAIGGTMSSAKENRFMYSLKPVSPNPFVNSTTIAYSIANSGKVSLKVFDITGRCIKTLVDEKKEAGFYTIKWNGCNSSNKKFAVGVYFTRLTSGNFTSVKKVILVR